MRISSLNDINTFIASMQLKISYIIVIEISAISFVFFYVLNAFDIAFFVG